MHVKLSVVTLSLTQAALVSHGLDEHGSGTVLEREKLIVSYLRIFKPPTFATNSVGLKWRNTCACETVRC